MDVHPIPLYVQNEGTSEVILEVRVQIAVHPILYMNFWRPQDKESIHPVFPSPAY